MNRYFLGDFFLADFSENVESKYNCHEKFLTNVSFGFDLKKF